MCGIAGIISQNMTESEMVSALRPMLGAISHRGPDDEGFWYDQSNSVGFGHRRLSILDLSPQGHQPMGSASGRFVLILNGEIYNFRDLKRQLTDYPYRGSSDTEVLLAAFDSWGFEKTLSMIVGMFAFALFDKEAQKVFLVRDRLGEKPLYYGTIGNDFVFASELKALRQHKKWISDLDYSSVESFVRYGFVPSPFSIYKSVKKLQPAHFLSFDLKSKSITQKIYWASKAVAENGIQNRELKYDNALQDELESTLEKTIQDQMISDVPLGAFLSGGIDSSLIVALMQKNSSMAVKTFSIGFTEKKYDESGFAKSVAQHLKTEHHELILKPEDVFGLLDSMPQVYDEPFADSSQLPTTLVAQMAKKHVTVALSGDGGDELFGGYPHYFLASHVWKFLNQSPRPLNYLFAQMIGFFPNLFLKNIDQLFQSLFGASGYRGGLDRKLPQLKRMLESSNFIELYHQFIYFWPYDSLLKSEVMPQKISTDTIVGESVDFMMFNDLNLYLPDDILVKVDRAGMSTSLESRAPFLDHRIAELAWRLPLSMKFEGRKGKIVLRRILSKYIPDSLIDRPKKGFGVPVGEWIKGPLNSWAEDLLSDAYISKQGLFESKKIQKIWAQHKSGNYDWERCLWNILMFQAWYKRNLAN